MIDINYKSKYLSDNATFTWIVQFPNLGLTFNNSKIVKESFSLTESLCDNDSLEFVGCIASCCKISLYDIDVDVKGQRMTVDVDNIPMFDGIVDSAEITTPARAKKITAYDKLYSVSDVDVASWYQGLTFPKTLKQIRVSLLNYLGLGYVDSNLPADNVSISKIYDPEELDGLTCLKAICQINGCCGIINRYGQFEFRFVKAAIEGLYPSIMTFPGLQVFPSGFDESENYSVSRYETMKYQEYQVKPVTKVQIRSSEEDPGITQGSGDNKYIIQANMWAKDLPDGALVTIAQGILDKLNEVTFHPCNIKGDGLPFMEVGDVIQYPVNMDNLGQGGGYDANVFLIMTRTFTGTQFLRDTFTARGTENQSLFITDLQTQIRTIMQNGVGPGDDVYTKEETDDRIEELIDEKGQKFVSCSSLPTPLEPNTVYLIQGDITIM